jgi:integrase
MSRHQRGYIFELHGAFHVRYYATENGERKQRSHRLCAKDRTTGHGSPAAKAVRALCEEFMRTINSGVTVTEVKGRTVQSFFNWTYYRFVKRNLKHSTVEGYRQVWNQHLKAHFGNVLLKDYRTPMMTNFLTNLARTARPRTLKNAKNLASGIFSHAVATGHCDTNPIRDARVLGKTLENGVTKSYTLEEMENVITALVDHVQYQLMMALAMFLGLRKGEIAGLQWGDVDDSFIHVRRACVKGVVGTPKTLKSVRAVPLIAPVRLLVGLWRTRCRSTFQNTEWVFPGETGNPLDIGKVGTRYIRPILDRAGVPWKGLHAGRRGLGTTLRTLTGNSNAGRDVLGHSDEQVTQAHYEAAMPEEALKGMKMLEAKVTSTTLPQ